MFNHVHQVDGNGCFAASIGILLGKTYPEARKLVYPQFKETDYLTGLESLDMTQAATELMTRLGIKVRPSKYRQLRSLFKYGKKHAIVLLRWKWDMTLMHAVVFDADTKTILDPVDRYPRTDRTKYPSAHIEAILWVDVPTPKKVEKEHAEGRDEQRDQRATGNAPGAGAEPDKALRFASNDRARWRRHLWHCRGSQEAVW